MEEQSLILKEYMELTKYPSLREMSKDTGIQLTRLFRIINGMEMKLKEYLLLKRKIEEKAETRNLSHLAFKCESALPIRARNELEELMGRYLKQQTLLAA